MTKEETRAVTFVGALLVLALVARFVTRPKPITITAGAVDIAALQAAGEALAERPAGNKKRPKRTSRSAPQAPGPADRTVPPRRWAEPAWRRPHFDGPVANDGSNAEDVTGPVDVNHANARGLDALPGIGPAVARRIIVRRDSVGRFDRVEDLDAVKGIGPALVEKLRGKVVFR